MNRKKEDAEEKRQGECRLQATGWGSYVGIEPRGSRIRQGLPVAGRHEKKLETWRAQDEESNVTEAALWYLSVESMYLTAFPGAEKREHVHSDPILR